MTLEEMDTSQPDTDVEVVMAVYCHSSERFVLAPMGAIAPGSANARPSAQAPIDTSRNFSAQVSGKGGQKN